MLSYKIRIVIFQLNFGLGRLVQGVGGKGYRCRHGGVTGYSIVDVENDRVDDVSRLRRRENETMNRRRKEREKEKDE